MFPITQYHKKYVVKYKCTTISRYHTAFHEVEETDCCKNTPYTKALSTISTFSQHSSTHTHTPKKKKKSWSWPSYFSAAKGVNSVRLTSLSLCLCLSLTLLQDPTATFEQKQLRTSTSIWGVNQSYHYWCHTPPVDYRPTKPESPETVHRANCKPRFPAFFLLEEGTW